MIDTLNSSGLADFASLGLQPSITIMPNGERRYAVRSEDVEGYVLTVAGEIGGWQNAHYHGGPEALAGRSQVGVHEHYVVQSGWMGVAVWEKTNEGPVCTVYSVKENETITFKSGESHNIYLPVGAIIHTVKTGTPIGNPEKKGNDWWPDYKLDEASKKFVTEYAVKDAAFGHPREYL